MNENEQTMTTNPDTSTEQDYIDTIAEMRKNSVPKEDFDKLREDNRRLMKTLAEGGKLESQDTAKDTMSIEELRKNLFGKEQTNMQYWQYALDLRNSLMEQGQKDPFLPFSHDYVPTEQDIQTANRVAEGIQHCLDIADGDPNIFNNEYQRITVDPVLTKRGR